MARTKSGQKISIDRLQASVAELEKLEEKPKEELTLRESIHFLHAQLRSALEKGYSYQDLSKILAAQEIKISAATLKQYLTDIDKQATSRKRGNKSKQVKLSSAAEIPAVSATPREPESPESSLLNADLERSTLETPQKQSSADSIEPEQEITKVSRRRKLKTSQPKANILDDFNQY